MKGLYSGSQIVSLKSRSQKITRSQTASQAYNAILKKYGAIKPHAHYFHIGKGVWHEWSMERDKQRTGKLASTKLEWAERPNKFDWQGIDTKEGSKKSGKFSISKLRSGKLIGRSVKSQPKFEKKPITKTIEKPKRVNRPLQSINEQSGYWILKRTFEAKKYPKGSEKRIELNKDVRTSEYNPSCKFRVMKDNTMLPDEYKGIESAKRAITTYIKYGDGITEHKHFMPRVSVTSIKHPSKLTGRKSKAAPKFVGEHVTKKINRPRLSISAIKSPAKPSNRSKKVQLKGSGKGVLKHIEVPKSAPSNVTKKRRVNRDKLSIAERSPSVPTKPIEKRISPIKVVTINGKQYTISANNALAFLTELKNKQAKNKLASMIKQAKAKELKGKDVSDDWANIVTFISQNMGQTNLKRLPTTASGYARFMGKKNDYQRINEKAYQIKKRNEEFNKTHKPVDSIRSDLEHVNKTLAAFEKSSIEIKQDIKNARKNGESFAYLERELEYNKNEIKQCKDLIKKYTAELESRTRIHPNNRKARLARAKLPKNPVLKNPGKLQRRTENKLKPIHTPITKGNYIYASFQRPIWAGFDPHVPYRKVDTITDKYSDPRWNRLPHDVIVTSTPISKETQYNLQLTDLREGAKMRELMKYVDKFDFLNDSMKDQLKSNILKGYSKEKIDYYIEKGRKLAEKKAVRT